MVIEMVTDCLCPRPITIDDDHARWKVGRSKDWFGYEPKTYHKTTKKGPHQTRPLILRNASAYLTVKRVTVILTIRNRTTHNTHPALMD